MSLTTQQSCTSRSTRVLRFRQKYCERWPRWLRQNSRFSAYSNTDLTNVAIHDCHLTQQDEKRSLALSAPRTDPGDAALRQSSDRGRREGVSFGRRSRD